MSHLGGRSPYLRLPTSPVPTTRSDYLIVSQSFLVVVTAFEQVIMGRQPMIAVPALIVERALSEIETETGF